MRFLNKYKLASRITSQVTKTPLKVLKFNRPKWEIIKRQFLRKNRYFVKKFLATVKKRSVLKARYRSIKSNLRLKTNTALQTLTLKFSKRKLKTRIKQLKPARSLFPFEYKLKIKTKKKSKLKAKRKSKTLILLKSNLKSKKKVLKTVLPYGKKKFISFQDGLNQKSVLTTNYKYNMKIKTMSKFKLVFKLKKKSRRRWKKRYLKTSFKHTWIVGVSKRHPRMKRRYADRLKQKLILSSLFDNSVKFARLTSKYRSPVIAEGFVKHLYRIDILLWYLKYYSSTSEAKQNMNSKKVLVNDKSVKPTYVVKEGDIISLNFRPYFEKKNTHLNIKNKFTKNTNFYSFLEFDKYTNSIIILKDLNFLTYEDYTLLVKDTSLLKKVLYK